jgi:ubiquinone/menaquinone biosynthesis C-methylase UbiE
MARGTSQANGFALELVIQPADHVLEVGFGHGATIVRLAAAAKDGFVAGVDSSAEMLKMASRLNREGLERKRVELRLGSAEQLPYPDRSFDKALAVHTLYFWSDLLRPFAETRGVLKRGARFVIAAAPTPPRHDPSRNRSTASGTQPRSLPRWARPALSMSGPTSGRTEAPCYR